MHILTKDLIFPPADFANEDGLLAIGGDLSTDRLLLAYRNGIFPWFAKDEPICWYCPDPRFVLFPSELKISNSMRTVMNKGLFKFTIDKAFEELIKHCQTVFRKDQPGTWITNEMLTAYINLHKAGYAHSSEAWKNGELVGGIYGIIIGKVFFGESMFSKQSNASKFAFIKFTQHLQKQNVQLIDCQVYTNHLESLGAKMIERKYFLKILQTLAN